MLDADCRLLSLACFRSFSNPLKAKRRRSATSAHRWSAQTLASSPAQPHVFTYFVPRTPTAQTGVADPHPSSVLSDVRFQTRQGLRQYQRRHPVAERLSPRALVRLTRDLPAYALLLAQCLFFLFHFLAPSGIRSRLVVPVVVGTQGGPVPVVVVPVGHGSTIRWAVFLIQTFHSLFAPHELRRGFASPVRAPAS